MVGLALVLPLTRAFFRQALTGIVARRLGVPGVVGGLAADHLRTRRSTPGGVVEGEVVEGRNADGPPPAGDGPSYG